MIQTIKFTEDTYIEFEYQLLDYVEQVALEFNPDMGFDADGNMSPCGTLAIERFKRRYNRGFIDVKFKYENYINNKDVQDTLKELGVDIESFWYLLLFVMDYTAGYCWDAIEVKESPKEQLEKLVNLITDSCSDYSSIYGATFSTPMTITINVKGKQTLTIDNPNAIVYLGLSCAKGINEINDNSILSLGYSNNDTLTAADTMRICLFGKMFLYFFEINKQFNKRQKKGSTISLSKNLLISRLAYFARLTTNKNYLSDDDNLKKAIKEHGDKKQSTINNYYF